ncbi:movement protein [Black medic leaf roll virus]|uniref:Movement protein n=1 Tax=Black medic leaf roll virus TaxID=2038729 RepID=V9TQB6_9VIRU|nr:movement protein [Black medic leaf roll virus]
MGDDAQGYEGSYYPDDGGGKATSYHVLKIIGIVCLILVCICAIWVCIMLACYIPGFVKRTLDAWLNSSSIMKRRVAATITRTPYEETGPERERRWASRRPAQVDNGVVNNTAASVFS